MFSQENLALRTSLSLVFGISADAVYDRRTGRVFRINHIAGKVLRLCDGKHALEEIVRIISDETGVQKRQVLEDVEKFMARCPEDWWVKGTTSSPSPRNRSFLDDAENKPLRRVSWECTNACNLQCLHCIVEAGRPSRRELKTHAARQLIEEMADAGVTSITMTGGEPSLRKDFLELVRLISKREMELTLLTNGTVIRRRHAEVLKDSDARVQVTILGSNPLTHDTITRVPGSFENVLRAIAYLRQARVTLLRASFVVMKNNVHDLFETRKLLERYGLDVRVALLLPVGRAKVNWRSIGLPPSTLKKLTFGNPLEIDGVLQGFLVAPRFGTISCPTDAMTIDSDGRIIPCSGIRGIVLDDVRSHGLLQIWQGHSSPRNLLRETSVDRNDICGGCELRYACMGGCRAVTFAYRRGLHGKNPFCELY